MVDLGLGLSWVRLRWLVGWLVGWFVPVVCLVWFGLVQFSSVRWVWVWVMGYGFGLAGLVVVGWLVLVVCSFSSVWFGLIRFGMARFELVGFGFGVGWLVGLLWLGLGGWFVVVGWWVGGLLFVCRFGLVCSVRWFGGFNWYSIWFVLLIVCYFELVWFGFGVFGSVGLVGCMLCWLWEIVLVVVWGREGLSCLW